MELSRLAAILEVIQGRHRVDMAPILYTTLQATIYSQLKVIAVQN